MYKKEAIKQLNIGYILILLEIIIGLIVNKNSGLNKTLIPFLFSYMFWSIYWGYKIAYTKISMHFSRFFNTPIHIKANGTGDFFSKSIVYKFIVEFIKFWICCFIGALGGAILKQIKLSKFAYF